MVKPFLAITDAERDAVNRVVARSAGAGNGRQFWDVYLCSIGRDEPVAHEAAALDQEPADQLGSYIDHYLEQVGLRRSEELTAEDGTVGARVEQR